MTDLTARELLDTILRSWRVTRATFKSEAPPLAHNEEGMEERSKDERSITETADPKNR